MQGRAWNGEGSMNWWNERPRFSEMLGWDDWRFRRKKE